VEEALAKRLSDRRMRRTQRFSPGADQGLGAAPRAAEAQPDHNEVALRRSWREAQA
jgi:hypothetical protein